MEDEETRPQAKQWAKRALHFDAPMAAKIERYIDTIPLNMIMPYCKACENALCGVCGECHSFDLLSEICPNDPDIDNEDGGSVTSDCVAWWQALKSIWTVQRESK